MFRILSIDGGGVRGIFPAYVLKQLSDTLDAQSLRDVFELVIGTSTGGIIAAAVAQDIPLQRVVELYEQEAPAIFGRKQAFNGSGIIRSRYPLVRDGLRLFEEAISAREKPQASASALRVHV